jgi:hypothetical protein
VLKAKKAKQNGENSEKRVIYSCKSTKNDEKVEIPGGRGYGGVFADL